MNEAIARIGQERMADSNDSSEQTLLPNLIPDVAGKASQEVSFPIVTGGQIRQVIDVHRAIDHGAFTESTRDERLWHVQSQKEALA